MISGLAGPARRVALTAIATAIAIGAVGAAGAGCQARIAPTAPTVARTASSARGTLAPLLRPSAGRVRKLAAAPGHTCALLRTGEIACWGSAFGPPVDRDRDRGREEHPSNVTRPRLVAGVTDAVEVAVGRDHACAARVDGDVVCWGTNAFGVLGSPDYVASAGEPANAFVVPDVHDIVELASRTDHTCARRRDGHVLCWGRDDSGQLGDVTPAALISAGNQGNPPWTRQKPPVEVAGVDDAEEIATGDSMSCARRRGGTVSCWGDPLRYGLANGAQAAGAVLRDLDDVSGPAGLSVDGGTVCIVLRGEVGCIAAGFVPDMRLGLDVPMGYDAAVSVVLGGSAECWTRRSGQIWCRGYNGSGELGDGTTTNRSDPVRVVEIDDAMQLVGGAGHFCALRRDGEVACWGKNGMGELGIGSDEVLSTPFVVPLANPAAANPSPVPSKVIVGAAQSCAMSDGHLACWGRDVRDVTGQAKATANVPQPVVGLDAAGGPIADAAIGRDHACAITTRGAAFCWGASLALGAPTPKATNDAVAVHRIANVADAAAISSGEAHACVRRKNGHVACWGQNASGELGDGTTKPSVAAVEVKGIVDAVEVACGTRHTCVLRRNGGVVCWGSNERGQIGVFDANGEPVASASAAAVSLRAPAVAIAAGASGSCALDSAGRVTCWGTDYSGASTTGSASARFVEVPGIHGAKTIAMGGRRACVTGTAVSNGVSCWTSVDKGAANVVPGFPPPAPAHALTLAPAALAVSDSHSCALDAGTVVCWGLNASGQVGDTLPYRARPVSPAW